MLARRNKRCDGKMFADIFRYLFSKHIQKQDHVRLFREEIKKYLNIPYVHLTASGRNGLSLILDYFNFPDGSEIILPAYTLKDLAVLIKARGLTPVFVDVDARTFNMDAALLEAKITSRTAAIIATHIFGMPCEIDRIVAIGRQKKIVVIEDCAHALGARYKNQPVGTWGDAGFFSLELTKPVNTFGGGVVVTPNQALSDFIEGKIAGYPSPRSKLWIKVFTSVLEDVVVHSFLFTVLAYLFYFPSTKKIFTWFYTLFSKNTNITNFSYSRFQAYVGRMQLATLDSRNRLLMDKVSQMRKLIDEKCRFQENGYGSVPAFYFNVIQTAEDAFVMRQKLLKAGIDIGIQDEIEDHCPRYFSEPGHYPVTDGCDAHMVQLPMSWDFDDKKIEKVARAVNAGLSS